MAWELILSRKYNQSYRGHAEKCYWGFTVALPDQTGASQMVANDTINAHIQEIQAQGEFVLEYRMWEDKLSGTFDTDYWVEVIASASPLPWALIIIGVVAILGLTWLIINRTAEVVENIAEYAPFTLPLMAIGGVVLAVGLTIYLIRRRT